MSVRVPLALQHRVFYLLTYLLAESDRQATNMIKKFFFFFSSKVYACVESLRSAPGARGNRARARPRRAGALVAGMAPSKGL